MTSANIAGAYGTKGFAPVVCSTANCFDSSTGAIIDLTGGLSDPGHWSFSARAMAETPSSTLQRAFASLTLDYMDAGTLLFPDRISVYGSSSISESRTLLPAEATLLGTTVAFDFVFRYDATVTGGAVGTGATAGARIVTAIGFSQGQCEPSAPGFCTVTADVTFGDPFDYFTALYAEIGIVQSGPGPASASIIVDAFHTLELVGGIARTSKGQVIDGWSLQGPAGRILASQAVPEPGAMWLGLAGLAVLLRRRV
ncbi:MAG: hypothetical protein FJW40_21590 [Acidobacteria bacterium]|nr:hypothetical protein [Acidobacteriota bacterium]